MDNETWLIDEGGRIVEKKSIDGFESLSPWEQLVYALWVADYGMRNAGTLEAAKDLFLDYQSTASIAAGELALPMTHAAFAWDSDRLEREYFSVFESICDEVRNAGNSSSA